MSGTSNKPSALVPGKRKTPPESSTPRVSPLLRNAGPSISDYDTSNEASNGLIVNVPNTPAASISVGPSCLTPLSRTPRAHTSTSSTLPPNTSKHG
ncbi:unnamed protein product [Tilletia laevis]|uniref:Uncharacterized protein n=1 Tax=Tilletia laevis TaxID=157183 RepID=A0A9N8MBZ2_9BASI|nr:hypothetical protein CF336_g3287 [Tilletia laevis]KAE8205729.1 hypothetical protein CF335_g2204 [Tilletia laevis]CAD6929904.1 unnamed protein product [Tilletia laevis]CAD6956451.1 unnamed protein product [Tilletia laevis]CAD7065738.1 unnamed protein product [Tilletia caries]